MISNLLLKGLYALMQPIARFCVRHSLRLHDIEECAKKALLAEARKMLQAKGTKSTASRLNVMTGVHRRDITRLTETPDLSMHRGDLITRVMGHWQASADFCGQSGQPLVLSLKDDRDHTFTKLVNAVSSDLNPATILFELERVGAIEKTAHGVKLQKQSYSANDAPRDFELLGKDVASLIGAVEENVLDKCKPAHLHVRTSYDKIPQAALPEIQEWLLNEGHKFHAHIREYLTRFDHDITPPDRKTAQTPYTTVTVGSFSHVTATDLEKKEYRG